MAESPHQLQFTDSTEMTRDRSISSGTTNSDPQQPLEYSTTTIDSSEAQYGTSGTYLPAAASSIETASPITSQPTYDTPPPYQIQIPVVTSMQENFPERRNPPSYNREPSLFSVGSADTMVARTNAERSQSTNTMSGSGPTYTGQSSAGKDLVSTSCQGFRYSYYAFRQSKPDHCEQSDIYHYLQENEGVIRPNVCCYRPL